LGPIDVFHLLDRSVICSTINWDCCTKQAASAAAEAEEEKKKEKEDIPPFSQTITNTEKNPLTKFESKFCPFQSRMPQIILCERCQLFHRELLEVQAAFQGCQMFLVQKKQNVKKYINMATKIQNGRTLYQNGKTNSKWP
jgi:hypothetical protein